VEDEDGVEDEVGVALEVGGLVDVGGVEVVVSVEIVVSEDTVVLFSLEMKGTLGKTISHEASKRVNKLIGIKECFFMMFINLILSFFTIIVLRYNYEAPSDFIPNLNHALAYRDIYLSCHHGSI